MRVRKERADNRFPVYWASAYRTPPVRGEDRVHLSDSQNPRFSRTSFSPAAADPGYDHEGGPSWLVNPQSSLTIATSLFAPILTNSNTRPRIYCVPCGRAIPRLSLSCVNIIPNRPSRKQPNWPMRRPRLLAATVWQAGRVWSMLAVLTTP